MTPRAAWLDSLLDSSGACVSNPSSLKQWDRAVAQITLYELGGVNERRYSQFPGAPNGAGA